MSALLDQASLLIDLRRYDDALRVIDRALAEDPRSLQAHVLRTNIYLEADDWGRARQSARDALAILPDWAYTHAQLALAILYDEDYEPEREVIADFTAKVLGPLRLTEALYHAKRAVELTPDSAYLLGVYARVHLTCGDIQNALTSAQAGLSLNPTNIICRMVRHDSLVAMGRDEEAARLIAEGLQDDPEHEQSRLRLGQFALASGKFDEALEHAQAALHVDPNLESVQSIYWTASAHLAPGVRTLADIRTALLRLSKPFYSMFRASPKTTIYAAAITILALLFLANQAMRDGNMVILSATVLLLISIFAVLLLPVMIWALLHVMLILSRSDRRRSIRWGSTLTVVAAVLAIAGYSILFCVIPHKLPPRPYLPPILAICPFISLLLSMDKSMPGRAVLRIATLICVMVAIVALVSARKGHSESLLGFLFVSGAVTLLAESGASHLERRQKRRGAISPKQVPSDKLPSR